MKYSSLQYRSWFWSLYCHGVSNFLGSINSLETSSFGQMWTLCQALALHLPWQAFWLATPAPSRRTFQIHKKKFSISLLHEHISCAQMCLCPADLWDPWGSKLAPRQIPTGFARQEVANNNQQLFHIIDYFLLYNYPARHQARPFHSKVLVSVSIKGVLSNLSVHLQHISAWFVSSSQSVSKEDHFNVQT